MIVTAFHYGDFIRIRTVRVMRGIGLHVTGHQGPRLGGIIPEGYSGVAKQVNFSGWIVPHDTIRAYKRLALDTSGILHIVVYHQILIK